MVRCESSFLSQPLEGREWLESLFEDKVIVRTDGDLNGDKALYLDLVTMAFLPNLFKDGGGRCRVLFLFFFYF